MAIHVFYNSRGDILPERFVSAHELELKGTNLDGDSVFHIKYYNSRDQVRVEYVTVMVQGRHRYVMGSGLNQKKGELKPRRWDIGNHITWKDAIGRRTNTLIR